MVIFVDKPLNEEELKKAEDVLEAELSGAESAIEYFELTFPKTYLFKDIDIFTGISERISQVRNMPDGTARKLLLANIYKHYYGAPKGVSK